MSEQTELKNKVFALSAAFSIIKDAVSQVTDYKPERDDAICFNSITKAIGNKKED